MSDILIMLCCFAVIIPFYAVLEKVCYNCILQFKQILLWFCPLSQYKTAKVSGISDVEFNWIPGNTFT